jgi:hypothetical protein
MPKRGYVPSWEGRLRDARSFWEVAEAAHDPDHGNQAASNAILAAIAANDAVCLCLGERRASGDSHLEAAAVLQQVCQGTPWEQEAALKSKQLLEVIQHKEAAQYTGRRLRPEEVDRIMKQVERFLAWAQEILPPSEPS